MARDNIVCKQMTPLQCREFRFFYPPPRSLMVDPLCTNLQWTAIMSDAAKSLTCYPGMLLVICIKLYYFSIQYRNDRMVPSPPSSAARSASTGKRTTMHSTPVQSGTRHRGPPSAERKQFHAKPVRQHSGAHSSNNCKCFSC